MGSFLSGVLGTNVQYQQSPHQEGNAYNQEVLQNELLKQGQLYNQQQDLANILQQQMQGGGPNPAQTQYQQNVQQNVANAQGLIASQRGLNAGLATKLGSNVAAKANQEAAAESALQQQRQQLAATGALGALYGQMQNAGLQQQGLYTGQNLGAMQTNAALAAANQQAARELIGGAINGGAAAVTGMAKAHGGMIKGYDQGGEIGSMDESDPMVASDVMGARQIPGDITDGSNGLGMKSFAGRYLAGMGKSMGSMQLPSATPGLTNIGYLTGGNMMAQKAHGGAIHNFKPGGKVPGQAKVSGDSAKNDTVPAMVSPGEIVIPRSVAMSSDAPKKAAAFVAAVMAREGMKKRLKK